MNPRQYGNGIYDGRPGGKLRYWPQAPLDFFAAMVDSCSIYSPLDTPQGLRRGFVFNGFDVRACVLSHAC